MGVYIKGMTAQQARMWLHYQMPFTFMVTNDDIIEIPESHGRLIDAKVYEQYCKDEWIPINLDAVDKQPTVIEAEGEQ